MILIPSSENKDWPWSDAGDQAEGILEKTYPSLFAHFQRYKEKLTKRQDQGKFYWELRSCAYYDIFEKPKIITQDLATYSWFSFDDSGAYSVNTCYIWPTSDLYFLGWFCSPAAWWIMHRSLQHAINDTLRMFREQVIQLPIAPPSSEIREQIEPIVSQLVDMTKSDSTAKYELFDWLRMEFGVEKTGQKLEDFSCLTADEFVAEVKKRMPKGKPLSPAGLSQLRGEYAGYAPLMQARRAQALTLERRLSDLVNEAYGLTPEEIALMWKTAPPRMPVVG